MTCEHPSDLARALAANTIDAGLVPIVELFGPHRYRVVDGVAIASDGPVLSVVLAHKKPVDEIEQIIVDPASLTSVHLLRVLLAEFHGRSPAFVDADPDPDAARLLIGNQALAFRGRAGGFAYFDLGDEWTRRTSLPFVYAAWLLRPELAAEQASAVADEFRALKRCGLAAIDEITKDETSPFPRELSARYLQTHIRFDLGPREKEGMARFGELLRKHALIAPDALMHVDYI